VVVQWVHDVLNDWKRSDCLERSGSADSGRQILRSYEAGPKCLMRSGIQAPVSRVVEKNHPLKSLGIPIHLIDDESNKASILRGDPLRTVVLLDIRGRDHPAPMATARGVF